MGTTQVTHGYYRLPLFGRGYGITPFSFWHFTVVGTTQSTFDRHLFTSLFTIMTITAGCWLPFSLLSNFIMPRLSITADVKVIVNRFANQQNRAIARSTKSRKPRTCPCCIGGGEKNGKKIWLIHKEFRWKGVDGSTLLEQSIGIRTVGITVLPQGHGIWIIQGSQMEECDGIMGYCIIE